MMRFFVLTSLCLGLAACSSQVIDPEGPKVQISDFESLASDDWIGSLTYLDYSSNKDVTIPVKASINLKSKAAIKYTLSYPKESWEDTKATIKISHSGRSFDGHAVTYRQVQPDGTLEIRTLHQGEDNGENADIRMTYLVGDTKFSMAKGVQFEGTTEFFKRNVYVLTKPQ